MGVPVSGSHTFVKSVYPIPAELLLLNLKQPVAVLDAFCAERVNRPVDRQLLFPGFQDVISEFIDDLANALSYVILHIGPIGMGNARA